jgi:hypothetical protein
VVQFAKQQLFWECAEKQASEDYPATSIASTQSHAVRGRIDFKRWDSFASSIAVVPEPVRLSDVFQSAALAALGGAALGGAALKSPSQDINDFEDSWTPTHPLIKYWASILLTYAVAKLTHWDDRLIAIAGLAKILAERTGIRYIAGHWDYQLQRQLLWSSLAS